RGPAGGGPQDGPRGARHLVRARVARGRHPRGPRVPPARLDRGHGSAPGRAGRAGPAADRWRAGGGDRAGPAADPARAARLPGPDATLRDVHPGRRVPQRGGGPMNASRATPHFLSQLADRARYGMDTLVRRDPDPRLPAEPDETVRRSAVLVLVAGSGLDDAQLVLEERGHALRSQPGQFSLPGGKADPTDRDAVHTAMREAHEETGLDPGDVSVLGSFAEIPMPWRAQRVTPVLAWAPHRPQPRVQDPIGVERRGWAAPTGAGAVRVLGSFAEIPLPWRAQRVTPVLAWAPHRPQLRVQDPIEVERLVWAPLTGAGSLTDPRRRMRGILHGQPVGPVFDLPDGAL